MHDFCPPCRTERRRGCGYRKPRGLYLVTTGLSAPCGKLPIPLDICPTCGHGIKSSRGWTWIDPRPLVQHRLCQNNSILLCQKCPLGDPVIERAGLIWIGEQFYPTPAAWEREAQNLGVSRRIRSVPRGFVLGQTWVFVAHRRVNCPPPAPVHQKRPAIFHAFRPQAIEYVMQGDEDGHELEQLRKRGITPVLLQRAEPQKERPSP